MSRIITITQTSVVELEKKIKNLYGGRDIYVSAMLKKNPERVEVMVRPQGDLQINHFEKDKGYLDDILLTYAKKTNTQVHEGMFITESQSKGNGLKAGSFVKVETSHYYTLMN